MKVAIASGKGGTGKTTVATSLVCLLSAEGRTVAYVDCDVEEPNGHIFLKPHGLRAEDVCVMTPKIDEAKCTGCGLCAEVCQYNALACVRGKVLVFAELCHGCGGCSLVCPEGAIREVPRGVGVVEQGRTENGDFVHGRLHVGEAMPTPVVREVKRRVPEDGIAIIDAPPGTSCPVVATLSGVDYVILVTEPTPFGLNDLKLAVGVVRRLDLAFGVVVNRFDVGDDRVRDYCRDEGIDILAEIPNDREVAEAYSRGKIPLSIPRFAVGMREIFPAISGALAHR